jgi:dTDP-4-dehydrorhamnose reductase
VKIVVTGAGGMLGRDLVEILSQRHQVIGLSHAELEILDAEETKKTISEPKPDLVIHAAAYTDVDGCEENPDKAYSVNTIGTQNVALACQKAEAVLLYISTDFVFDGTKGEPYLEWDKPEPINVYGKSKYAGERVVAHLLNRYYIVRTAWLYGEHGGNFPITILKKAKEKGSLEVVSDQVGSPTFTYDVVRGIERLIETDSFGIYHMVNRGECSWYDFARKVLDLAGYQDFKIKPITSEQLSRPAKRPSYSVLRNFSLEKVVGVVMRSWEEAIGEFMQRISF